MNTQIASTVEPSFASVNRIAVSMDEAAEMIGVSRRTVWTLCNAGTLASAKIGKRRVIPVSALDVFLASRTTQAITR